ncbi:hypothetical protein L6164_018165 [Bauhinia variegata]|uniref:Uncharacterized protein n=1 Tax=Bauhinia variegata TaxID=167791 RepID=A0ACB9NAE5_BAUVA|nr:hypothetical protein L6164_018165 [Bauhinia variegata]
MAQHNQNHAPVTEPYASPVMAYPPPPPPPVGYPTMDVSGNHQNSSRIETKRRGEGFWKGCVAALCCCWVVEFCCG